MTKVVGNVTKDSEVTFEYGIRQQKKKKKTQPGKQENPLLSMVEEKNEFAHDTKSQFENPSYELDKESVGKTAETDANKEGVYDNARESGSTDKPSTSEASDEAVYDNAAAGGCQIVCV